MVFFRKLLKLCGGVDNKVKLKAVLSLVHPLLMCGDCSTGGTLKTMAEQSVLVVQRPSLVREEGSC